MLQQCVENRVEQSWWNSVVKKRNSNGGTVEQSWWNSGTVIVEQ